MQYCSSSTSWTCTLPLCAHCGIRISFDNWLCLYRLSSTQTFSACCCCYPLHHWPHIEINIWPLSVWYNPFCMISNLFQSYKYHDVRMILTNVTALKLCICRFVYCVSDITLEYPDLLQLRAIEKWWGCLDV